MLKPIFKLIYENKDITRDVAPYVLSIHYDDKESGESDEIQIVFEDSEKLWQSSWIPSKGDRLRLYLGYEGEKLLNCGVFEIDEIELDIPPDTLTVKAVATNIKKALRQNNSVAYENKTLKQIAQEVAQRHNLKLVGEIDDIKVERITQNQEHDLTFLKRLAEEYGYIFKITEDSLVFYKTQKIRGAKSTRILYRSDFSKITLRENTSQQFKAVSVSYHNPKTGKVTRTSVKNNQAVRGDTLKIDTRCENKEQAILKAKTALEKGTSAIEGSFEMSGRPDIVSGLNAELKELAHFSGKYHIVTAKHSFDRSSGYKTSGDLKSC